MNRIWPHAQDPSSLKPTPPAPGHPDEDSSRWTQRQGPDDACADERPRAADTPPYTEGAPEAPERPGEEAPREPDSDTAFSKALKVTSILRGDLRLEDCTSRFEFRNLIDLSSKFTLRNDALYRKVNGGATVRVLMAPHEAKEAIMEARSLGGALRMGTVSRAPRQDRRAVR